MLPITASQALLFSYAAIETWKNLADIGDSNFLFIVLLKMRSTMSTAWKAGAVVLGSDIYDSCISKAPHAEPIM